MLAHRLRRWPNIKPTFGQRLVLAGIIVLFQKTHQDNSIYLHRLWDRLGLNILQIDVVCNNDFVYFQSDALTIS